MKLGIMQPYFFPYLGYFALINNVDQFILFDTPQYIRHGWIERNRILNQNGEPLYIKVPLRKHSRETAIKTAVINNDENWKAKIIAQLMPYKKKAPNFRSVLSLVSEIIDFETESIVALNHFALKKTCEFLEINTPIRIWSEMNEEIEEVKAPDEWALNISKALKANHYINPIGGVDFFNKDKYEKERVKLSFLKFEATRYPQFTSGFQENLSVIDALMFNSPELINEMLDNYELI